MNTRTPFTYCITFLKTGQKYYGVRFKPNCNPSDLWTTYFTSSKEVKRLIEISGIEAFDFEIRKIFLSSLEAQMWEYKVLRRLKVRTNKNWINLCERRTPTGGLENPIWITDPISKKERFIEEDMLEKFLLMGYRKGRSERSLEWRENKSKQTMGENNPNYGKRHIIGKRKMEHKKRWVTNGVEDKLISLIMCEEYLRNGWMIGRTQCDMSSIKSITITKACKCGKNFSVKDYIKKDYCSITCSNKHHQRRRSDKCGEHTSQYGTMWITDGVSNRKIKRGDELPEGFFCGRVNVRNKK